MSRPGVGEFAASVQERHADLAAAAREAKEASDDFAKWLVNNSGSKKRTVGSG